MSSLDRRKTVMKTDSFSFVEGRINCMVKKAKSKELSIAWYICGTAIIMGFIWLNTFIHQNSFNGTWGNYEILKIAVIASVCTVFYYGCFFDDSISIIVCDSTKLCAISAAISGALMLFALLLELGSASPKSTSMMYGPSSGFRQEYRQFSER